MSRKNDLIQQRYDELCDLITRYNRHYYEMDSPLVSDADYDLLMNELVAMERKYPSMAREDSPAQRVGGEALPTFSKVAHDPPMMSLGNIFSEDELVEFDERCRKNLKDNGTITYSGELKFDGLAVEVVYEKGVMKTGATRGNGSVGEDVTANLSTIKSLPVRLNVPDPPEYLSVRGEVYLTHEEFERLNESRERDGDPTFANPRNAASGSLRQLDPRITEGRTLDIVFYASGVISGSPVSSQKELFDLLDRLGIPKSQHRIIGTIDKMKEFYLHWYEHRHTLEFDIDGVVVKISDFAMREALGATSKAPRWAVAWKFPSAEAVTLLESVDFQVGRTGLVTPVANLRPINIGGVMVKRATLHNFREIERLGVRIGDTVTVKRAGDVIPKIVEVHQKGEGAAVPINPPGVCPSCGSKLLQEDIFLRCVNAQCEAVKLEKLKFFVSKDGMDIEFFGPELVNRLYESGRLRGLADFFSLTRDDLLKLERMGDKLADKILESIAARRRIPLSRFLQSLGIKNVGEHIASVIAKEAVSMDRLLSMDRDTLQGIHEVGPQVAESVYTFFRDPQVMATVEGMMGNGMVIEDEPTRAVANDLIAGRTFVFTGTLLRYTRDQCEEMVRVRGGRAAGSVSGKTDFVVAGESAGSKLAKARELGVKVISENDFIKMVEER